MHSTLLISNTTILSADVLAWLKRSADRVKSENVVFINETFESISVETIREISAQAQYGSSEADTRFFVLLAAEKMSLPAQNAILKILEEPPEHTVFVLATSNPDYLLPTIHSRCIQIFLNDERQITIDTVEVQKIVENIKTLSHGELINLADTYSSKENALLLCSSMLLYLHQNMASTIKISVSDTKISNLYSNKSKAIENLTTTIDLLQKNVNARLALEHCFFELKALLSSP